MKDTRANSPLIPTMLHYVANFIEEKYPDIAQFYDELHHCEQAAKGMTQSDAINGDITYVFVSQCANSQSESVDIKKRNGKSRKGSSTTPRSRCR